MCRRIGPKILCIVSLRLAGVKVVSDDKSADGSEIGRQGETYRRVNLSTPFGGLVVLVTDGHLPYPFGRETTGYEVKDLKATLDKASRAGVKILSPTYEAQGLFTTMVEFPGGYIAEIHARKASKAN